MNIRYEKNESLATRPIMEKGSLEQVALKLAEIFAEPQEEMKKKYFMVESVEENHNELSVSELDNLETKIGKILRKRKECCKIRENFLCYLEKREKGTESQIVSSCLKYIKNTFFGLESNKKICVLCQELKKDLIDPFKEEPFEWEMRKNDTKNNHEKAHTHTHTS